MLRKPVAVKIALILSAISINAFAEEKTAAQSLELHGYISAGVLVNQEGNKSDVFKISPWFGHYRLGNENNNKMALEPTFHYTSSDGVRYKVVGTLEATTTCSADYNCTDTEGISVQWRQGYVAMDKFDFAPDVTFWAGKRNNQWNTGAYIWDFDPFASIAGTGGGVENVDIGFAHLDMGLYSYDTATDSNYDDALTGAGNAKIKDGYGYGDGYNLNLWFKKVMGSKLDFQVLLQNDKNGKIVRIKRDENGNPTETTPSDYNYYNSSANRGYQLGLMYNFDNFYGLANGCCSFIGLQYGNGIGAGDHLGRNGYGFQNLNDQRSWRISTSGIAMLGKVNVQPFILYQHDDNYRGSIHTDYGWKRVIWTAGIRPSYQFTEHFMLDTQVGYEYLNDENNGNRTKGGMGIVTVAPTLTFASGFFTRPQIRVFGTYAKWSDGLMGPNKSSALANSNAFQQTNTSYQVVGYRTDGFNFGVQGEVWW